MKADGSCQASLLRTASYIRFTGGKSAKVSRQPSYIETVGQQEAKQATLYKGNIGYVKYVIDQAHNDLGTDDPLWEKS